MNGKQPATGILATIPVIAISLFFIHWFSFPVFSGWVAFYTQCTIPMQIIVGITWGCRQPEFAAKQEQPMKGLLLTLITVIAGIIASVALLAVPGGNITPPTPMLMHCTIVSVAITFWISIMWGGWPFRSRIRNIVASGIAQLASSYGVTYLLFRVFFSYEFMKEAPVYVASLDPHGLFNAWSALVYIVTALSIMFLMLHFELWPLRRWPAVMNQPVLGLVWTAIALIVAAGVFRIGINVYRMDTVQFMVTVPISFIFGTIVTLNMLEGSLFKNRKQPIKGLLSAVAAVLIGTGLSWMYQSLAGIVTGRLHSGPPSYDFEIWLASSLLAVTFPFLIISAVFFDFWPFKQQNSPPE
jgi:hypothetical protein